MIATLEGRQATIEQERAEAYTAWRHELLADSRLAPFRVLWQDLIHFGNIRDEAWQRFENEKDSRHAERLTEIHHERPDYYFFDAETGDIVIYDDPVKGRYTMRDMYQNGLEASQKLVAERGEQFAFQLRRDEIFMQTYEQVAAMMRDDTDYDTIVMCSTFPIEELEENQGALREKFYDLEDGKQFEYVFQRIELDNGVKILGMDASTLYSPQEDLQIRTMHGKAALAAVQNYRGANVPHAMVSSHEQNGYIAMFNAEGATVEEIVAADAKVYDAELQRLTGRAFDHGREDVTINAYELFARCPNDRAAYKAYYEMFARHMAGEDINPYLRDHLLNLLSDYRRLGKTNNVINAEGLNRLFTQVWHGTITPDMQLAVNEIMDYAHSALMKEYMIAYKRTGILPEQDEREDDILTAYSGDSGGANSGAVGSGLSFADCEDGNGVSDISAAIDLAEQEGMTFEEALRAIQKRRKEIPFNASLAEKYGAKNVFVGVCGACESIGEVGPCGRPIVDGFCNECDSNDRLERGYILNLYNKRMARLEKMARQPMAEKDEAGNTQVFVEPSGETVAVVKGVTVRYEQRLVVGGVKEVLIDIQTGAEVEV